MEGGEGRENIEFRMMCCIDLAVHMAGQLMINHGAGYTYHSGWR